MKSTPNKKRIVLEPEGEENLLLFGIVSSEPDYKLSLALNRKIGITLRNISPVSFTDDSGNELLFSKFSSTDKSGNITFSLISNRYGRYFLIKKLRNIDYILHVHSPGDNAAENIETQLRQAEEVNAVFILNADTINDRNLHYLIQ